MMQKHLLQVILTKKQIFGFHWEENVFNLGFTNFNFDEVSDKQINKGLDLEGGINVILQISVKDILKGLSSNSKTLYLISH
jgi:preprotein translocase subunit SecD